MPYYLSTMQPFALERSYRSIVQYEQTNPFKEVMMTEIQYAPAVGEKFYEDGSVRQFAGNTVICFADPESEAYQSAEWVQGQILSESYADKFTMLPPSSFHMTVFELLCDQIRTPDLWSSKLALDTPLIETDDFFIEVLEQVPRPDNFKVKFSGLHLGRSGLMFGLEPINDEMNRLMRGYRDRLAEVTGVRQPHHDDYGFHLSLAYRIIETTDAEEAQLEQLAQRIDARLNETFDVFDTGQPQLTFFDDMFAFVPENERFTLKSRQV